MNKHFDFNNMSEESINAILCDYIDDNLTPTQKKNVSFALQSSSKLKAQYERILEEESILKQSNVYLPTEDYLENLREDFIFALAKEQRQKASIPMFRLLSSFMIPLKAFVRSPLRYGTITLSIFSLVFLSIFLFITTNSTPSEASFAISDIISIDIDQDLSMVRIYFNNGKLEGTLNSKELSPYIHHLLFNEATDPKVKQDIINLYINYSKAKGFMPELVSVLEINKNDALNSVILDLLKEQEMTPAIERAVYTHFLGSKHLNNRIKAFELLKSKDSALFEDALVELYKKEDNVYLKRELKKAVFLSQ